ncbi:MAG: hypothetical protein WC960_03730 [Bacteroidales bacterium]
MCSTNEKLDQIENLEQLKGANCELEAHVFERGNQFMMTGESTLNLDPSSTGTITIPLVRLDAKVHFRVVAGTIAGGNSYDVTFIPESWRLVNAPIFINIFPKVEQNLFTSSANNFFTTEWNAFDQIGGSYQGEFSFYALENRQSPRQEIPNNGTLAEQYALRAKQEKLPTGTPGNVENGEFIYAPQYGTFVEIKGVVSYDSGGGAVIYTDVTYLVHLGFANNDPNDFSLIRNSEYIYTVTINSVNSILLEVEQSGQEPQPSAEGTVVMANNVVQLDAYYSNIVLNFPLVAVDNHLKWSVSTPFSSIDEEDLALDYQWVLFRVNKTSSNNYTNNLRSYPGDSQKYSTTPTVVSYISDLNSNNDKLLDVDQLIVLLKESKTRKAAGQSTLFDNSNNIKVTAFVNEFYYERDPINPTNPKPTSYPNDFWKEFVNQPDRILNILSSSQISSDGKSMEAVALHSIRQAAIKSIYNQYSTENFSAWGTQQVQDHTKYQYDKKRSVSVVKGQITYLNNENGRESYLRMHQFFKNGDNWSSYINAPFGATTTTPAVQSYNLTNEYNYARWKCMQLNRDNNGDGKVDIGEVRWYLASIDQLRGIWMGEPALKPESRLHILPTWSESESWYASSTITDRSSTVLIAGYDIPTILWSAEGASDGLITGITGGADGTNVKYRCVRNLGMNDASYTGSGRDIKVAAPQPYATITGSTIDLSKMHPQAIRQNPQPYELSTHHERSATNKPWVKFEIASSTTLHNNTTKSWIEINTLLDNGTQICPLGWRAPTQRELTVMRHLQPGSGWTAANSFSRSSFSFNPLGGQRFGFSVEGKSNKAEKLYLINGTGQKGGVRCIREIYD